MNTDSKALFFLSISITFFSWIFGFIINEIIKKRKFYLKLSNIEIIRKDIVNEFLGVYIFKWIVRYTFFKYFNLALRIKSKFDVSELNELRKQMTYAEISHLIGFGFMSIIILVIIALRIFKFAIILLLFNVFMNLYPALLQQLNKKRIDKILKTLAKLE